jgi:uncharacterized OsmC-like protein
MEANCSGRFPLRDSQHRLIDRTHPTVTIDSATTFSADVLPTQLKEVNRMEAEQLKALQTPIKQRYRDEPRSAVVTIRSMGTLDPPSLMCRVATAGGEVAAGLHPAAGGDGSGACSGDMLLDALVACAGVTLNVVSTSMGIDIRGGCIKAEGEMDFRGTLGISKEVPVGLTQVRLRFELDTDAEAAQVDKLIQLTERYCVIYQTLQHPTALDSEWSRTV